jgi:hypothetical protein
MCLWYLRSVELLLYAERLSDRKEHEREDNVHGNAGNKRKCLKQMRPRTKGTRVRGNRYRRHYRTVFTDLFSNSVLTVDTNEPAERKPVQGIFSFAYFPHRKGTGWVPDAELIDTHTGKLRHEEVTELMHNDENH